MNKKAIIGITAGVLGVAAGVAVGIAVKKVVNKIAGEMQSTASEHTFTSPEGNNTVTLECGSSESAKGLTRVRITATSEGKKDDCTLVAFAKKSSTFLEGEWIDNDHFKLFIGSSNRKQCCDVAFVDGKITATYYLCKTQKET
jgi:hypothetical protein